MIIVTKEEIKNRISSRFLNQPFEVIEYTKVSNPFEIKCLKCGEIKRFSSYNNFFNSSRKFLCSCYNKNNNMTKHKNNEQKIKKIIEDDNFLDFIDFSYKKDTKKYIVIFKCLKCGQIINKTFEDFLRNSSCPYCTNRSKLNTLGFKASLPEEYELLSDYIDENTKVLIRHKKCGFIWKIIPRKIYNYIGCPRCNKKRSKGEQKIQKYLEEHSINYEIEKKFNWQTNLKRRYDIFVPSYNLIIEYNGEQHYNDRNIKHFKLTLEEQQKIDEEKKEEAINNNYHYLIIGYFDFNNINKILDNWFNDYPGRE